MVEQLEFDPAMFGMKSNHGMLRSSAPKSQGSGANAVSVSAEPSGPSGGQGASFEQSNDVRGGQRGGRGAFNRGRGGNRGGRGAGRGAFNGGQRPNDGQPFKRQRFDGDAPNRAGPRGFFKPSMLEDPWSHLS